MGAGEKARLTWEIELSSVLATGLQKAGGSGPALSILLGLPVPGRWLILLITDIGNL